MRYLTSIRQQNFMIKNNKFFVYSVGATIGRPLGYAVNQAGEHSSPLHITIIKLALHKKKSDIFLSKVLHSRKKYDIIILLHNYCSS